MVTQEHPLRIGNRRLRRAGGSYSIVIPAAFVDTELLDPNETYDVVIQKREKKSEGGLAVWSSPDLIYGRNDPDDGCVA